MHGGMTRHLIALIAHLLSLVACGCRFSRKIVQGKTYRSVLTGLNFTLCIGVIDVCNKDPTRE